MIPLLQTPAAVGTAHAVFGGAIKNKDAPNARSTPTTGRGGARHCPPRNRSPSRAKSRERGWYNPPAPARWCTASHAVQCKGFMRKAQSINAAREKNGPIDQSTGQSSSLMSPESSSKRFQKRERSACFPSVDLGRWAAAVEPPKMGPEGLQEVTINGRRSIAPIAPRAQGPARSVARSIESKIESRPIQRKLEHTPARGGGKKGVVITGSRNSPSTEN